VALALSKTAHTHEVIAEGAVFSVNIFDKADQDIIKGFTKSIVKNPDKVKDADFSPGAETGCPIITGAAAYLECRVVGTLDSGGDHDIMVGEVVAAGVNKEITRDDTLTLRDIGWSYAG
jgi:flavin reductase (DIM6/NTAB) family NADH-FMN oxidoreductase RutF